MFTMSNTMKNNLCVVIEKPNQFPWKLYDMLHTAEKRNEEFIISWIKDGTAFKVHNRDLFIERYMKKSFNQTKFKSFQRQLNLWGFERVQNGPNKGSYFHPSFVNGQRECCQLLTRVRLKGTGEKAIQHTSTDKVESPFSSHSASSIGTETNSTTRTTIFPVAAITSTAIGIRKTAKDSPISLLGAFVDVSRPISTLTTETICHAESHKQQFVDSIQYQKSQERRDMIRNAAIGLSPDLSIAVVGAPVFAAATDDPKHDKERGDEQLHQVECKHQMFKVVQTQDIQKQQDNKTLKDQQQQLERIQIERQSQIDIKQPHRRITSSGLEALLSVSAQRRREEELALMMSVSDHGAMPHTSR